MWWDLLKTNLKKKLFEIANNKNTHTFYSKKKKIGNF